MTRRRLLLFAFPAAMLVGLAGAWLLWPRTAITRDNAEKLQKGMTLAEVEAILGGPARNESDTPDNFISDAFVVGDARRPEPFAQERWAGPGIVVIVDFDDSWRVVRHSNVGFNVDRSLFDKLRRWLRL